MELVLTLLAVGLLLVLPIVVFLLVIGGSVYAIGRAIRGERKVKPAASVVAPQRTRDTEVLAAKVASTSSNKGA